MKSIFSLLILTILLTVFLSTTLLATTKKSAATKQVKITDTKNNSIQLISDEKQLNRFNYFWSQKQQQNKPQAYQWRYQLIIQDSSGETRWVYDPKGYAREISMNQSTATYQIMPIRSFNRFLTKEK